MSRELNRVAKFVRVIAENGDADSRWLFRVRPRSAGYSERHWTALTLADLRTVVALANERNEAVRELVRDHHPTCGCRWCAKPLKGGRR